MNTVGIPLRCEMLVVAGKVESCQATEAVKRVEGTLVLSGGTGCGKTVAASMWLMEREDAYGSMFVSAARLARWPRYDDREMGRLLTPNRLVIDDLGSEYADEKGNFLAILDEVIADRHANMRPTVITTNLTKADFKERYKQRIADRIRESGRFVSLADPSQRPGVDWAEIGSAYEMAVKRKQDEQMRAKQAGQWAPERNATPEQLAELRDSARRYIGSLAESKALGE